MLKMRQLQAHEETPTFKSGCEPAPHFYHSMTARCSLDDFIRNNRKEVRVGPYSKPVEFSDLGYKVPPGALFDLRVLQGEGYQLESTRVEEGTDISKDVGLAFILDQEGHPTGYFLASHGGADLDGSNRFSAYLIESTAQPPLADRSEQYAQADKKFGEVLWGPRDRQ